jgi:hypothetical protein
MIKAILIGGGDLSEENLNRIKEESIVGFSKTKSISTIVIPFARYEEDWIAVYEKNTSKYKHDDFLYEFVYPSQNREDFLSQLEKAQLVIIPGGSELGLKKNLPELSPAFFDNKTIIATSAGTNFLATLYYSNDRKEIAEGTSVLNINTICHFKNESIGKVEELVLLNSMPTFAIKEGDFIVVYGNK